MPVDTQLGTVTPVTTGAPPTVGTPVSGQTPSVAASTTVTETPPSQEEDFGTLIERLQTIPEDKIDELVNRADGFGKLISKRIDRAVTEYDKRRQREQRERETTLIQAKSLVTEVESTPLDQRALRFQQDPSLVTRYQTAKEELDGNPHVKVVAERMKNKVWQQLSEQFKGLNADEALRGDVADLISYVADQAVKAKVKEAETTMEERIQAAVNAELAKRNLLAPQAPRMGAGIAGTGGNRFTLEQISNPIFYAQHRDEIMAARRG